MCLSMEIHIERHFSEQEQTHWAGIEGYTGQCQKIMPESSTLASL